MRKANPAGQLFLWTYILVAVLLGFDLLLNQPPLFQFILKPLLLPLLFFFFLFQTRGHSGKTRRFILMALLFSWMGDLFLLPWPGINLFLLGLGSFLIAQLLYSYAFWSWPKAGRLGRVVDNLFWAGPFLLYLLVFLWFLWSGITGGLKVPVLIYGTAICIMGLSAFNLSSVLPKSFGMLLLSGAILFMVSDSLIGIRLFQAELSLPFHQFWVMSTYMAAQGLIVWSIAQSYVTSPS